MQRKLIEPIAFLRQFQRRLLGSAAWADLGGQNR